MKLGIFNIFNDVQPENIYRILFNLLVFEYLKALEYIRNNTAYEAPKIAYNEIRNMINIINNGARAEDLDLEMTEKIGNTQYFSVKKEPEIRVKDVLSAVYSAMAEKGYNPVNQIVGYLLSEDPTYITTHANARSIIRKIDRDDLLSELVKSYLDDEA